MRFALRLLPAACCSLSSERINETTLMPLWTQPSHSCDRSPTMRAVLSTAGWWLATAAWAALIFHLSTPAFGADRSIPILARLLPLFDVSVSHTTLDLLDTFIRKLAHLTEYAILALLLYRSCLGRNRKRWDPRLASWCVVIAALYSMTDEYHQSFASNRGASALDCVLDITGAAAGMLLAYVSVPFSGRNARVISVRSGVSPFSS
jgi:VanZ family protein